MIENDFTFHGTDGAAVGFCTCAKVECMTVLRYNADAKTKPRYCKKHTEELRLRGLGDGELRALNTALKRRTVQEVVDDKL